MKLIGLPHSPYSARVRMQVYAKGIDLEHALPEGFGAEQFRRFNLLGKVPVLDTGDRLIPESIVIMDYLEDTHPEPALRPADPGERAAMNVFYRFPDVYIQPLLFPLFLQLTARPRDEDCVQENIAGLSGQMTVLGQLIERFGRTGHKRLDLADCALVPILYYSRRVPEILKGADVLAGAPLVARWWQWVQSREPAARVIGEIETALEAFLQRVGRTDL